MTGPSCGRRSRGRRGSIAQPGDPCDHRRGSVGHGRQASALALAAIIPRRDRFLEDRLVTPGTVLSMLLCASAPFLLVFVVPRGYRAPGFLGMVARLVVLMSGAVVLAYPAGMLLTPGAEPHRQVVLTAAAAPLVALAIAWWFSDFGPRTLSRVAVRAAVLLALCVLAALVTRGNVMYGGTRGWTGICAATIAVLLCVATWRITDLHGPSGILKRAGFVLVACIGIA